MYVLLSWYCSSCLSILLRRPTANSRCPFKLRVENLLSDTIAVPQGQSIRSNHIFVLLAAMEDPEGVQLDPVPCSFQCGICGKASDQSLNMPSSTTDTFLYQSFSSRRSVMRYDKLQNRQNPYKSGECGKRFPNDREVNSHAGVHTNKKKFACDYCFRTYKYARSLSSHKCRAHSKLPTKDCKADGDNGPPCLADAVSEPVTTLFPGQSLPSESPKSSTSSGSSSPSALRKQLSDATEAPASNGASTNFEYVFDVISIYLLFARCFDGVSI